MASAERYAELFATESRDNLTLIEHALLELERSPLAREPVDALFRAVHTLKGMSGVMGYHAVGALAHAMESQLARLRSGDEVLTTGTVEMLFEAADALSQLISVATAGGESALDVTSLLARLSQRADTPAPAPEQAAALPEGVGRVIRIALDADTPLPGARAQLVLNKLAEHGEVVACAPDPSTFFAEHFQGAFAVRLQSDAGDDALERLVRAAGYVRDVVVEPSYTAEFKVVTAQRFEDAWSEEALKAPLQRYIRVDIRRLDSLLNLVGELVIQRGRLATLASMHDDPALEDAVGQTTRLIAEIQDGVLGSRMVPVWQVVDRFPRVVRDAARSLGKQVEFHLHGREIELDRVLLEQVAEPLVHLLRNAVDHGLEMPDERRRAGKPAQGALSLTATRERSAVVLSVRDDGRGISRSRVLAKAKAQGLVDAEREDLTDEELLRVIARPGFSTAERVTDVSGRGVGIDAVYNRVRSLGGTLECTTAEGEGTTFSLRLPVTLAIVPALLARVCDEAYALPLTHVTETLQPRRGQMAMVRGKPAFVLRDEVLPLVSLHEVLGLPRRDVQSGQIVIVQAAERRAALVVDRLIGQHDIVVKPFDAVRGALGCFGGATILPDGSAALILDVGAL